MGDSQPRNSVNSDAVARVVIKPVKEGYSVVISGSWKLGESRPEAAILLAGMKLTGQSVELSFNCQKLAVWDDALLLFLRQFQRQWLEIGGEWALTGLPDAVCRLWHLSGGIPVKVSVIPQESPLYVIGAWTGSVILSAIREITGAIEFTGECVLALREWARGRQCWKWRDAFLVCQEVGIQALPIVSLISFLVGAIIAFLGIVVLMRFGAEFAVSYIVGYGILREMGAVMAGITMAGRTGSAFAAQIGSMKVSEELDALRVMGVSPVDYLVVPRLLAFLIMMPILTIYSDFLGVLGGYLVSSELMDIPPAQFYEKFVSVVGLGDFFLGIFKGTVFGFIVAFSGCMRGMQCGHDANAIGVATTRAVVTGITLIIFVNAIIDWMAALFNI
jgi:phospholipid/cholesterol/gamma-HCH transport system permease protein